MAFNVIGWFVLGTALGFWHTRRRLAPMLSSRTVAYRFGFCAGLGLFYGILAALLCYLVSRLLNI